MRANRMSKNKTRSLTLSKQIKEKCVWMNNLPLNIIKLATMDHMEWTAVNIADIAMTTTATM